MVEPVEARRILVVGIGTGDAAQLTGDAVEALRSVDYVVAAEKRDGDPLLAVRRQLCEKYDVPLVAVPDPERDRDSPDYDAAVRDWHEARVAAYEQVLLDRPGDVAFLVWGDPAFYDSTLRIVRQLEERGAVSFTLDVVPGISSPQLLAARHRIVLHDVGLPIVVTTGRRLDQARPRFGRTGGCGGAQTSAPPTNDSSPACSVTSPPSSGRSARRRSAGRDG